jgi:hypothetical protein
MDLGAIVRSAVTLANSVTGSAQVPVTLEAWTGTNDFGEPTYAAPATHQALVEEGSRPHRTRDGNTITVRAHVAFLYPVALSSADRLTLPSGLTGPIVDMGPALVDPATGRGYCAEVFLG